MTARVGLIALGAVLLLVLGAFGVVWNEARKEVVSLCANFSPGVTRQSVMQQLGTANLLKVSPLSADPAATITVGSPYNFGFYECVIGFDDRGVVESARVR